MIRRYLKSTILILIKVTKFKKKCLYLYAFFNQVKKNILRLSGQKIILSIKTALFKKLKYTFLVKINPLILFRSLK